jgi:hypothetical protein
MSVVRKDLILFRSIFSRIINVPLEKIDIANWLFTLPDAEYQRCCPPDHIAVGSTTTDDGRPMSINVEKIGTDLMIQHFVGEIVDKQICRMVSTSDVFTSHGRTKVQVIWELSVRPIDYGQCEYSNLVISYPTEEFLGFIRWQGMTFEQAARERNATVSDHNRRETPLFAESIARAAIADGHYS